MDYCKRYAGRIPLLHLKDCGVLSGNEPTYAEVGNGNLDFSSIIDECEAGGTKWFVVEQDECPGDPFDNNQQSFEYINQHFVD